MWLINFNTVFFFFVFHEDYALFLSFWILFSQHLNNFGV